VQSGLSGALPTEEQFRHHAATINLSDLDPTCSHHSSVNHLIGKFLQDVHVATMRSALLLLALPHGRAFSLSGRAVSPCHRPVAASSLADGRWARVAGGVQLCDATSEIDGLLAGLEVEADAEEDAVEAPAVAPAAPPAPVVDPLEGMTEGTWVMSEAGGVHTMKVAVAGKVIKFESGKMARLASGAVTVTAGGTNVFCAATLDRRNPPKPIDFTPLRVDYCERQSAAGRTPGGYIKRDGRPSDHETLVARLIDRPIRPLVTAGWSLETQLATYVFSYDGINVRTTQYYSYVSYYYYFPAL